MYNSLEHNRRKFLEGELSVQGFKLACKTAVDIAMPDLKIHRGCKEAVYKVLNRVISIVTFGISAAITYGLTGRYNMFTPKTESEGKALDVDKAIQNIKPR